METNNLNKIDSFIKGTATKSKEEFILLVGHEKLENIKDEISALVDGGVQYSSFKETGKMSPFNSFQYGGNTIHMIYVDDLPADDMILTKVIK